MQDAGSRRTFLEGVRVLIEGGKIGPDRGSVPLPESRKGLERQLNYWKLKEPRQAKLIKLILDGHRGGGYDLIFLEMGNAETIDAYLARGVEYFVVTPMRFTESRRAELATVRLLDNLRSDSRIVLVKRFEGRTRTQLGPTVEIFHAVGRNATSPGGLE